MKRALGLLSVLILVGCGTPTSSQNVADADQKPAAEADVADSPSDSGIELAIVDYQGVMEHVAENRGKVVVMDAWSTSCPPCLKEFHNLVELHNTYGPEKVACISLSFDYEGIDAPEDQAPRVLEFLESQGATFDNLMSNEESDVLYRKFDLAAVPAVFVYDQQGKLRKRFDNEQAKSDEEAFTYEQIKALVAELLAERQDEENTPGATSE